MHKKAPFCTDACNTSVYYAPVSVQIDDVAPRDFRSFNFWTKDRLRQSPNKDIRSKLPTFADSPSPQNSMDQLRQIGQETAETSRLMMSVPLGQKFSVDRLCLQNQ